MESKDTYQIGELAARSGLTPDALRYYERLGLLPRAQRTAGGFRVYTSDTVERLRFIKQAQTLGLTLHEISTLVSYQDQGGSRRCRQVRDLLRLKLEDLRAKLSALEDFEEILSRYLTECERTLAADGIGAQSEPCCPVIEELQVKR